MVGNFYPQPVLHPNSTLIDGIAQLVDYSGGNQHIKLDNNTLHALEELFLDQQEVKLAELMRQLENSKQPRVITLLETDSAPESTPKPI